MSREIMRQALDALRLVGKYTDSLTCYASTISEHEANRDGLSHRIGGKAYPVEIEG